MSTRVAPLGSPRAAALLALVIVVLCAIAPPALATEAVEPAGASEEEGHSPTIDEIGTNNEVSNQYKPEPAEAPPFMRFLYVPMAIVGILVALGLLFAYLTWQPRFAEERRSRRRR